MLYKSVDTIKGVGPKRKTQLKELGISTIKDLLYYFPKEFEDRSEYIELKDEYIGSNRALEIQVLGRANTLRANKKMSILKVPFIQGDKKGDLIWFNQNYIKHNIFPGKIYRVFGKIEKNGNKFEIQNPILEGLDEENQIGKIVPIYGLTKGISNTQLINIMHNALFEYSDNLEDFLSEELKSKYKLIDKKIAINQIHFPADLDMLEKAKQRLIFEELFNLQLGLFYYKNYKDINTNSIEFNDSTNKDLELMKSLPYTLTRGQNIAIKEIFEDMESKKTMNRLLQGDVGSGKTIVAILAMNKAVISGYQVAMMVPTEILAIQQFESVKEILSGFNYNIELLTGSKLAKEKEEIKKKLDNGDIDIIIGTHALLEENVTFKDLGLVITDEQHRFGVNQRKMLNEKGLNPDILVMTATPIPRTLAYILYGDLDISVIDELPPNRQKISTYSVGIDYIERVNIFMEKEIEKGRQVYIVAPLVEDSEEINAFSAESLFMSYQKKYNGKYNVGLIHGQMKNKEKDEVMMEFKNKNIDIIIATTVIEVGVNVPNASLMLIYNAERFGLAQLHQLRGRVGRGQYKSYCILINQKLNEISRERMDIMIDSENGFMISEKDLELRGPGEFFGTRQHGIPELKIANLFKHIDILKVIQKECKEILEKDPYLNCENNIVYRKQINEFFKDVVLEDVGN